MKTRRYLVLLYILAIITEGLSSSLCQEQDLPVLPFLVILGTGMTMGRTMCPTCPVINCPSTQQTVAFTTTVSTPTSTMTTDQPCDANELQALRDEIVNWNFCQTISNSAMCNADARCTFNVNCGAIQNK